MKTIKKKENWIKEGLELLREKGIHAVKVEVLACRLGVTKGSFYWYFQNRDALLQEMLGHWERVLTDDVINAVQNLEGSLREKLSTILTIVDDHMDENIEKSMTSWSFRDERANIVVNRVVRNRIDFMKDLFIKDGFSDEDAELRARLMHSFVAGDRFYPSTCEAKNSSERKKMLQSFVEVLCQPVKKSNVS
jgi:AcrR family transcriptional regulator